MVGRRGRGFSYLPHLPVHPPPSDLDDILDFLSSDGDSNKRKPGGRALSEGDVLGKQGKPITFEEEKGQQEGQGTGQQRGRRQTVQLGK